MTTHAPDAATIATASTPDTIVLVHGLWMTLRSWEKWAERYEEVADYALEWATANAVARPAS